MFIEIQLTLSGNLSPGATLSYRIPAGTSATAHSMEIYNQEAHYIYSIYTYLFYDHYKTILFAGTILEIRAEGLPPRNTFQPHPRDIFHRISASSCNKQACSNFANTFEAWLMASAVAMQAL